MWLAEVKAKAKRKNQMLFSKDSVLLDELRKLIEQANRRVQVVCDLEWCYLVQIDEEFGYLAKDQVSQTKINTSSGGGSNSGGGDWTPPAM